ncbi:MAG: phage tail terminator family protein [Cetobacterium sp.]|uniref:phage tail terminator family protein n=1 Tax=Cetobacterium sp. TaxID=2071632 RepID=UPI003F36D787
MKISDVRKAISKALYKKTGLTVHKELIEVVSEDYLYIELANYKLVNKGQNRALQKATWQVKYIPTKVIGSQKEKIFETLENIDLSFDRMGKKVLDVGERKITLINSNMFHSDDIGIYMFETELLVPWGTVPEFELMQNLKTEVKKHG